MEISSKKLERSSKIIYFTISLVLCFFLILLTNKFIDDIDNITQSPSSYDFENQQIIAANQRLIDKSNDSINAFLNKKARIDKTIEIASLNYSNEKESFDNWLKTRKTIGSPTNDKEVLMRAQKLDEYYKIEQDWNAQLSVIEDSINQIQSAQNVFQENISKEQENANELYTVALHKYDLKVFLIRLLLVTPILLIGIWFFFKYRKNKYWPLFQGFSLYSLYAFFFGLVPYLPSYGGYIRYTVGILLSVLAGYYAINRIRKYLELKKIELETSSKERSKNVKTEVAEKALANHVCPSCGKDFILKNWEYSGESLKTATLSTDFCRFCGLDLFAPCEKCGTKNFVHLPFCSNCGEKTKTK
jgi:ribosomal protein L32